MYRVVLDPAVLIAALISASGAPRALLAAWMDGAFELVVSPKVLAELARLLKRPKFRPYVAEREALDFLALLERFAAHCPESTPTAITCLRLLVPRAQTFCSRAIPITTVSGTLGPPF